MDKIGQLLILLLKHFPVHPAFLFVIKNKNKRMKVYIIWAYCGHRVLTFNVPTSYHIPVVVGKERCIHSYAGRPVVQLVTSKPSDTLGREFESR